MTIYDILQSLYSKSEVDFISGLEEELQMKLSQDNFISKEQRQTYVFNVLSTKQMLNHLNNPAISIRGLKMVNKIKRLFVLNGRDFVQYMFNQLKGHDPSDEELQQYLIFLNRMSKKEVYLRFLSAEISNSTNDMHTGNAIGIFLGYHFKLLLRGEGIGGFTVRLMNGLLANDPSVSLVIGVDTMNSEEVHLLVEDLLERYKERISIVSYNHPKELNNIHVNGWIVPYVGLKNACCLRRPIILCIHDLVYTHFPKNSILNQRQTEEVDETVKQLAAKATKVIFNSEYIRQEDGLKYLGLPKDKTQVIRLATPKEEYENYNVVGYKEFVEKYNLYRPYIVFPTVVRYYKNHVNLIEGFFHYKKSHLGSSSPLQLVFTDDNLHRARSDELTNLLLDADNQKLLNDIVILGRLPAKDIPSLYKYAKGTIVPTLFEGSCPFPILESLLMETPVAVSRIQVTYELLGSFDLFYHFDPTSVTEIAKAVYDLEHADEECGTKQKKSTQHQLNRSWIDVANEYLDVFREMGGYE
ncbi:glycosyltransferase [Pontibacillus salicampi]|uniref:Glycosyltransferase n=1 Tax=Pontibacillus salicampi TaxID=1449801 RepID=A0ABV6LQI1_9BACI